MFDSLRQRMILAVSLTCVAAPTAGCKKDSDDAAPVEGETKKKKKPKPDPETPTPKKEKAWVPTETTKPGPCTWARFCTTNPEKKPDLFDGGGLYVVCGSGAKVPASVVIKGFENVNATLDHGLTEVERKAEPDACCYSYQTHPCGKGRPMRYNDTLVVASEIARTGWGDVDVRAAARELVASVASPEVIAHLRSVALLEHASVAAFASVSLELMSLGAPASLVEAAHIAALDEIRHARIFWSLIEAVTGETVGPGPMTIPHQAIDVERILVATVVEGCVGETLGSLLFFELAARAARATRATPATPALAAIYRTIAEEEATHAELAFRIVRFLVGADPHKAALANDAARRASRKPSLIPGLDEATQQHILDRGFLEVVVPALSQLAATPEAATLRA